jgi:hypothetical protein
MLKTISAALLAVSVLAAPALAAGPAKTTRAPVAKTEPAKTEAAKTEAAKTEAAKTGVLNANAMGRHHHKHVRHHLSPKHMGALKTHKFSKVSKASLKHVAPAIKRG